MKIAVGADHAGFLLKEELRRTLEQEGYQVIDRGTDSQESCDFPDYAEKVARDVAEGRADRGVLVCWTGVGMSIAANKVAGIRAALGTSPEEVELVRAHNDANVLTLGAKFTDAPTAKALVDIFLSKEFDGGGRHSRRVAKIAALESKGAGPPKPEGTL